MEPARKSELPALTAGGDFPEVPMGGRRETHLQGDTWGYTLGVTGYTLTGWYKGGTLDKILGISQGHHGVTYDHLVPTLNTPTEGSSMTAPAVVRRCRLLGTSPHGNDRQHTKTNM